MIEEQLETLRQELRRLQGSIADLRDELRRGPSPGEMAAQIERVGVQLESGPGETLSALDVQRADEYPWGPMWNFGIEKVGLQITVYTGYVRRGNQLYASGVQTVTISSADPWIAWRLNPATNNVDVIAGGSAFGPPQDADGYVVGPLYRFAISGSTARLAFANQGGMFPQVYA